MSCPFHDDDHPPGDDDVFTETVNALVTGYLFTRHAGRNGLDDGVRVTVHAEHDDDHDIFLLKIGLGEVAYTVMAAEHDAQATAEHDGGA